MKKYLMVILLGLIAIWLIVSAMSCPPQSSETTTTTTSTTTTTTSTSTSSTSTTSTTTTSTTTSTIPGDWAAQSSGTTNDLHGVHFFSTNYGWAVGDAGTALYTTDGGSNWHDAIVPNSYDQLRDVFFPDVSSGWTVGANGAAWKTTNAGQNWSDVHISGVTAKTVWTVWASDDVSAWAFGEDGLFKTTTDGGSNWAAQNFTSTNYDILGSCFVNSNTAWAVGQTDMLKYTTNAANYGGVTWTSFNTSTSMDIWHIHALTSTHCVAVGNYARFFKTSGGGNNWVDRSAYVSPVITNNMYSVSFGDAYEGWAVGANGTVVKSTDSGSNWVVGVSNTTNALRDVYFVDTSNGWAVGANGTILKLQ